MKKWMLVLVMLLLLTACGKEDAHTPVYEPYGLEVEYGDSGVQAMVSTYNWNSVGHSVCSDGVSPLTILTEIPFVNETKDKKLNLLFEEKPDSLEISMMSSADGYASATPLENPKTTIQLPKNGASYLYEIHAVWEQDEKKPAWGDCYYYFRYLPADATGEQERETTIFRVLQMEATDLFGVVMTNHLDGQQKTTTDGEDKQAVLDYLKTYLASSFVPVEAGEIDYELRLACVDGTELELAYGADGEISWLVINGQCYEVEVMDLYSLWKELKAEAVDL